MNKITILSVDDWSVMYVNDNDEYQGHNVPLFELQPYCPIESILIKYVDETELGKRVKRSGGFPSTLKECEEIGYQ